MAKDIILILYCQEKSDKFILFLKKSLESIENIISL
jgi:hypothetical protein